MTSAQPFKAGSGFRRPTLWAKRRGHHRLTPVGVVAGWLLLTTVPVPAVPVPAQDLSQRLPPPPPLSDPNLRPNSAMPPLGTGATLPDAFPNVSPNAVYRAPASDRAIPRDRYIVYVNGNSPLLLQQVRSAVPNAFPAQYQGQAVIQTGTFGNLDNAQRQIQTLKTQGIPADMLTANPRLPLTSSLPIKAPSAASFPRRNPPNNALNNPSNNTLLNHAPNATARYVIVIPTSPENFSTLTAQAIRLGVHQNAIQQRQSPLGPHLEIGPFAQRSAAEEANRYLRQQGLDARVVFNR